MKHALLPLELPSGRKIEFATHNGEDARLLMEEIVQSFKGEAADRHFLEHAMALPRYMLQSVDGQPPALDHKDRYDDWDPRDVEFYELVYRELTQLTEEERNAAREAAKSLRGGARPRPGAPGS